MRERRGGGRRTGRSRARHLPALPCLLPPLEIRRRLVPPEAIVIRILRFCCFQYQCCALEWTGRSLGAEMLSSSESTPLVFGGRSPRCTDWTYSIFNTRKKSISSNLSRATRRRLRRSLQDNVLRCLSPLIFPSLFSSSFFSSTFLH